MPTARQCEIQNSMFGTPVGQVGCYFPVQNMVRVIKGKIISKWSEGKQKLFFELAGGSSYRGFELPRVKLQ